MPLPKVTPVLSVGGTFSAGDYVGTSGTAMEFQNCGKAISASQGGGGGYIVGAFVVDKAVQNASLELWVFSSPVTPPNDNAAFYVSDADMDSFICTILISTYYSGGTFNSNGSGKPDCGAQRYECASNRTSLYGCAVNRATAPVWSSLDLTFGLNIIPDE